MAIFDQNGWLNAWNVDVIARWVVYMGGLCLAAAMGLATYAIVMIGDKSDDKETVAIIFAAMSGEAALGCAAEGANVSPSPPSTLFARAA